MQNVNDVYLEIKNWQNANVGFTSINIWYFSGRIGQSTKSTVDKKDFCQVYIYWQGSNILPQRKKYKPMAMMTDTYRSLVFYVTIK